MDNNNSIILDLLSQIVTSEFKKQHEIEENQSNDEDTN